MKVVYTDQAIASLQECLDFLPPEVPAEKVNEIRDRVLAKADKLSLNPYTVQKEEYLSHMGQSHRRVIEGIYKIIYRVKGNLIIITDIFASPQDPSKMKG